MKTTMDDRGTRMYSYAADAVIAALPNLEPPSPPELALNCFFLCQFCEYSSVISNIRMLISVYIGGLDLSIDQVEIRLTVCTALLTKQPTSPLCR